MMLTTASLGRSEFGQDSKAPQLRPAGVRTGDGLSAKDCLAWGNERPPTPDDLKKYRQSTVHMPGVITKHYGAADDPVPQGIFGVKSKSAPGESVAENVFSFPDTEMGRWQREQQEAVYASNTREPLGAAFVRGHKIPEHMGTTVPFGIVYDALAKSRAGQAGHCMFPTEDDPALSAENPAIYTKSHGAYAPGEQRVRDYDWASPGIDPARHRFGLPERDVYRDGVRKAMQPQLDETAIQPTRVVSKVMEDHKLSSDLLAKPRKLGAGERSELPPDHVFGASSLRKGVREPGVEALMRTAYPADQQEPDADLGKSLREGYRNIAPDDNRAFGTPSIRIDVALPKARSVADTTNYGNDPDALQLLRPPLSAARGVGEEHYAVLRHRGDVRSLAIGEAGLSLSNAEFDAAFALAAVLGGSGADMCTLDGFFKARHRLLAQSTML